MKEKIVLGLSGGVDSAVAARLLQERYEVTGLYLDIGLGGTGAADAAAVAERLGIPFETADIRAELEREVCAPFVALFTPTIWPGAPPCPAPAAIRR